MEPLITISCPANIHLVPLHVPNLTELVFTSNPAAVRFFFAWRKVCRLPSSSCCRSSRTPAAMPAFLFLP
nr:MAG TPA: hypothetical protein [Caudoviricetes sp.]